MARKSNTKTPPITDERAKIQDAVNKIPLANFGNVKVRYTDETKTAVVMRAFSPADAVRLIAGLRELGYSAHG